MTVRPLELSDIPILEKMATDSGFEYIDPRNKHTESVMVAVSDDNELIACVAAEKILQLYFWIKPAASLGAKMSAMRLFHLMMAAELSSRGYNEVNAFLPPSIAIQFGRRLERTFGWKPNWPSWFRRI